MRSKRTISPQFFVGRSVFARSPGSQQLWGGHARIVSSSWSRFGSFAVARWRGPATAMPLWNWVPVPSRHAPRARRCRRRRAAATRQRVVRRGQRASLQRQRARLGAQPHRARRAAVVAAPPLRVGRHADRPLAEGGGGHGPTSITRAAAVAFVDGANPDAWPSPSGGLAPVKALARRHLKPLHRLKHADFDAKCKNEQYYSCPCFKYNVEGFCTHPTTGRSPRSAASTTSAACSPP